MLPELSPTDLFFTALIFVWTGFVRSGLGFGGAALGLPLMLFVVDRPLFWLPVIGWHLLFFSALTLRTRLDHVDWGYLRRSGLFILPAALVGVFGLLSLPNHWLVVFIYTVTLLYALTWVMNTDIRSTNHWLDKALLVSGGYIAGTSLTGAPLMVAVYARNVAAAQLRNTLFVLWFILVSLKMSTFALLAVDLQVGSALLLLPVAAIGHVAGLKVHERILANDQLFKRVIGAVLMLISVLGLWQLRWPA
jgi:uncharacterized membrane protein YfcA